MRLSRRALGWLNLRYRSVISHMRVGESCMGAWWCDQSAKVQAILHRLKKKAVKRIKMSTKLIKILLKKIKLKKISPNKTMIIKVSKIRIQMTIRVIQVIK